MLLDTHCHLTSHQFQENQIFQLLREAKVKGVYYICIVSETVTDFNKAGLLVSKVKQAEQSNLPKLFHFGGLHPVQPQSKEYHAQLVSFEKNLNPLWPSYVRLF